MDRDRGCPIVLRFGGHDVWNESLRVAVIQREPGALDFDHEGVSFFEHVVDIVQAPLKFIDFTWFEGRWRVKSAAVSSAEDLHVGHELEAAHGWVGVIFRILIDEFSDEVGVATSGGGEYIGDDFAGNSQIVLEDRELPDGDVPAIGHEALVFDHPSAPF